MTRFATFPVFALALVVAASCGRPLDNRTLYRNGGTLSELTARPRAGGTDEGPLGFSAAVSHSASWDELTAQGIDPATLPHHLDEIRDQGTTIAVMRTFSRDLGVRCNFCHVEGNFAAPTPRKAVADYMWQEFVQRLQFRDGTPVYCDSCHHGSPVFLRRDLPDRVHLLGYMNTEYVGQLRRKDGGAMFCETCHGSTINLRMLPRLAEPPGGQHPYYP